MKTFFTIIEKHSNKQLGINIFTEDTYKKDDYIFGELTDKENHGFTQNDFNINVKHQIYFMMNMMVCKIKNSKSLPKLLSTYRKLISTYRKFNTYGETMKNIFLTKRMKEQIREIFYHSQRTYHAFIRLAQIFRMKHSKIHNNMDLSLVPIEPNQKNIIIIYQNKTKYLFTMSDIINIILSSITNAPSMFAEPFIPKNPYNNLPFSKAILYHIYWTLKASNMRMPSLINNYFESNFNLNKFIINNEQAVREYTIKKYVMNSPVTTTYDEIVEMLANSNKIVKKRIKIDAAFPKNELVEIMKPYLFLYIMKIDGIRGTEKRRISEILFKRELQDFINYNPGFGRKIFKCVSSSAVSNPNTNPFIGFAPLTAQQPLDSLPRTNVEENITTINTALESAFIFRPVIEITNNNTGTPPTNSTNSTPKKSKPLNHTFSTSNPGLTIAKIERMFKDYSTINFDSIYDVNSSSDDDDDESIYDTEDEEYMEPFNYQIEHPTNIVNIFNRYQNQHLFETNEINGTNIVNETNDDINDIESAEIDSIS